jgi:hypothetical protein
MKSDDPNPDTKDHPPLSRHFAGRWWVIALFFFLLALFLIWEESRRPSPIAVSKGGPAFEILNKEYYAVDQALARQFSEANINTGALLESGDFGYLYAYSLSENESLPWRNEGCQTGQCAQATYYDYTDGGTLEIIINMPSGEIVDYWRNKDSRPGASSNSLPRAIAIAADDSDVRSILGDIRQAESMMPPMSTWLIDNSCRENWCVDLTFASPDGSGRIFHVVVDMELGIVARTFFTRGRPERVHQELEQQEPHFEDGCQEQYDWKVCWEMTAHDGLNFYDASFAGRSIFSSAKIGQVEVYYPSWPGGYRDEIGYDASVRPYYGTRIDDLGEGFEVRQLFTEFLSWPNCVCCYRYEQIVRFFADGSYEMDFVSHGPGCDELSTYRPFWRINLAEVSSESGDITFWDSREWIEAEIEIKLPLFERLSPSGEILSTFTDEGGYKWIPQFTDPLEQDEGWLFLLTHRESEGDGPIATGPADSFWPPGQWLDGETLSGNNPVLWYVPILKTKHGEPWWCMPDPEPDYSPCNAVLRAESVGQELQITPTPSPSPEHLDTVTPTVESRPTMSPTPFATSTLRPIAGEQAQGIILNSGCGSCHVIGSLGESGKVGPDLSNIGIDAGNRAPGQSADEFIRESILNPSAFIAPNCPNGPCLDNIMPADYKTRLTDNQIRTLVDFLLLQQRTTVDSETVDDTPDQVEIIGEGTLEPAPTVKKDVKLIATSITIGSVLLILVLSLIIFVLLILLKFSRKDSSEDNST